MIESPPRCLVMFQFLIGFFCFCHMAPSIKGRAARRSSSSVVAEIVRVNMFSLSRSKLTQSTLSLASSEEFDDCFSQMGSPQAPSPSRYNYQERVLALFIQKQRADCTSSSSSSSSTSPSPDDATPLGVCRVPLLLVALASARLFGSNAGREKSIARSQQQQSRETCSTRIYFVVKLKTEGRFLFVVFEGFF